MIEEVLELNGLSKDLLEQLSYKSKQGISLKKDIHYFDKEALLEELKDMNRWLDKNILLVKTALDYRVKSMSSIARKYEKYYPDHQVRKVFNDILGFRAFCDNYEDILNGDSDIFRVADMSNGKANDDGYRGVHVYFQIDNSHYPIEIQFNTLYDRQLNNWLHEYLYKKGYDNSVGRKLRKYYEMGKIRTEQEFKEALEDVLSNS